MARLWGRRGFGAVLRAPADQSRERESTGGRLDLPDRRRPQVFVQPARGRWADVRAGEEQLDRRAGCGHRQGDLDAIRRTRRPRSSPTAESTTGRARTAATAACCSARNHSLRAIDARTGKAIAIVRRERPRRPEGRAGPRSEDDHAGAIHHAGAGVRESADSRARRPIRDTARRPAICARSTCAPASWSGPSTPFRIPASSGTTPGRRMRGRPWAAPTSGARFRSTKSAASSTRRRPARSTTSTAPTARAPTCSPIACWRSMRAPASACGISRWCTTTSGITTMPPRRSC